MLSWYLTLRFITWPPFAEGGATRHASDIEGNGRVVGDSLAITALLTEHNDGDNII